MSAITLPLGGAYVVSIDPDITGIENIAWAFANEDGADTFRDEIREWAGRESAAWVTFEPVAASYDDPDFQSYRRARLGLDENNNEGES